jgi:hypothetical protein
MSQFTFNEQGVCENPILYTYKCIKGYEAQVNVAIVQNGNWSYSISFKGQDQGWSQPLIYHAEYCVYKTKDEAFNAGLELLLNQVKQNNDAKKYDRIVQILQDELCPVVENQLTLF